MSLASIINQRFLIADGFKNFRDTLKLIIHSIGVKNIDLATSSKNAIKACKARSYGVVLMGYDLGEGKNGQQILEELRLNNLVNRSTIFIMLTAESSQAVVLSSLEHKPDEYMVKPFTAKQLIVRLDSCARKKQEMAEIYNAMDLQQWQQVEELCDLQIAKESRYINEVLGIKSRTLFEQKRFDEAAAIYHSKLDTPHCQWAFIGLGKIALEKGKYDEALRYFKQVNDENPLYLSAYDWIAKTYELQADFVGAEKILARAVSVSPKSAQRLKSYADMCLANQNFNAAVIAYKKMNELSKNSVHYTPEIALSYGKALVENLNTENLPGLENIYKDVYKALNEMVREFNSPEIKLRSKLLSSCLYRKQNSLTTARQTFDDAEKLIANIGVNIEPDIQIEMAQSYSFFNKQEQADEILERLLVDHVGDDELLSKIDRICEEPLTESGKEETARIVKTGVSYYNKGQYQRAIKEFSIAERKYPKHLGIRLNLMQALLMAVEEDHLAIAEFERCQRYIEMIGDMPRNSPHFGRFRKITEKFTHLQKELEKAENMKPSDEELAQIESIKPSQEAIDQLTKDQD